MALRDALLPEFDHEMANTRKALERVSDSSLDHQPHQKSYTMRQLASHLANIPSWVDFTLRRDELDFGSPEMANFATPQAKDNAELLSLFDANVKAARKVIEETSDEEFGGMWTMREGEKVYFTMPKIAVMRGFIMNHSIHHRGQLTVYLRLNDLAVPSIYGPSADDPGM